MYTGDTDADVLRRVQGTHLLFLQAGDEVLPTALRRVGEFLGVYRDAVLLYGDDKDALGTLKPKRPWAPHAVYSLPGPWHGLVFRRDFVEQQLAALLDTGVLDAALCLLAAAAHLPGTSVLYVPETFLRIGSIRDEPEQYRQRLVGEWNRQGLRVDQEGQVFAPHLPPVSIILGDRASDGELLAAATRLLEHPRCTDVEVIVPASVSRAPRLTRRLRSLAPRVRVIDLNTPEDPPSLPALYNAGAAATERPVLVFLHPWVVPGSKAWLEELVTTLHFAAAAAAVPRLLTREGQFLPAGRFLGDTVTGVSPPPADREPWDNVGAAPGIAFAVRRSEFEAAGCFDERYCDAFFDLAFSLRLRARGGSIVAAKRCHLVLPESIMDPVLRNDDAEAFLRDGALPFAPADRLLCTLPGRWESYAQARSNALQPETPVSPDDAAAVAGWALEHSVTLHAPQATLTDLAQDGRLTAAFILQSHLEHREYRRAHPLALSEGEDGTFCSSLCRSVVAEGFPELVKTIEKTFAADPGNRIRQIYLEDRELRFFHPLGLIPEGCWRLAAWLLGGGRARHNVTNEEAWWFLITVHEQPERWLRLTLALAENDGREPWIPETGVNIVGPLAGNTAERQTAESADTTLRSFGVSVSRIDSATITPPGPTGEHVPPERHDITLLVTDESLPTVHTHAHLVPMRDRYRIGYWHWPFSRLPADWRIRSLGLDEIWVPSRFAEAAALQQSSVPVFRMPMACAVEAAEATRSEFGLPADARIFLSVLSDPDEIERKNPVATMRAFRHAFRRDDRAILVLKTSGFHPDDMRLRRLQSMGRETGVEMIDEQFSRAKFLRLLSVCDAFVSLHRCTSLGRTLAEAMLLAKPCIATNYAGNLDFMNELNSRLITHIAKPVDTTLGARVEGQEWGEANVPEAAHCMRWIHDHPEEAEQLGAKARLDVEDHFDPRRIARAVAARLAAIRADHG